MRAHVETAQSVSSTNQDDVQLVSLVTGVNSLKKQDNGKRDSLPGRIGTVKQFLMCLQKDCAKGEKLCNEHVVKGTAKVCI